MMNAGDTAWVLVGTGLVMIMLPGLALFYGGLVSSRNVLVMLQQNIFPLGLVSVLWVLAGFSLAFGPDAGGGVIGNLAASGLRDLAFSCSVTWIIATAVARTIGLRVLPADENDLDRAQETLSAYALGRQDGGLLPVGDGAALPALASTDGQMKLV